MGKQLKTSLLTVLTVRRWRGVTLIELMISLVLLGLLSTMAVVGYSMVNDKRLVSEAITDIRYIETMITHFQVNEGRFPDNLAETDAGNMVDPWGNPYQYTNLADAPKNPSGKPMVQHRKDKFLNPINSDYDLYSAGKDGLSVDALTATHSHDDIVRAGNGLFVDLAEKY